MGAANTRVHYCTRVRLSDYCTDDTCANPVLRMLTVKVWTGRVFFK